MNSNISSVRNVAAIALGLSLGFAAPQALAQGTTSQGTPAQPAPGASKQSLDGGIGGAIQNFMKGLNIGPMMMSFGGADGSMIDFTRSNESALLKRPDVRSELFIDSKQRDQLDDVEKQGEQDLQKTMIQTLTQNLANNPDLKNLSQQNAGGPPDLGALKETLNTTFQTMQDSLKTAQTSLDGKIETVLRPKQTNRLRELDLQWRGLLALSEKKVAEQLSITPDQQTVVDIALKEYLAAQTAIVMQVVTQTAQIGQPGAGGRGIRQGFDPSLIKKRTTDALEGDDIKKARTTAEDKIRATLTADQKLQWKKMIGEKFYFQHLDK